MYTWFGGYDICYILYEKRVSYSSKCKSTSSIHSDQLMSLHIFCDSSSVLALHKSLQELTRTSDEFSGEVDKSK